MEPILGDLIMETLVINEASDNEKDYIFLFFILSYFLYT
jgi:hypothetical protein